MTLFFPHNDEPRSREQLARGVAAAYQNADELLASGPDKHGLVRDEIAAVHFYTQELVYRALNCALWSERRDAVKPYWGFMRLLRAIPSHGPLNRPC